MSWGPQSVQCLGERAPRLPELGAEIQGHLSPSHLTRQRTEKEEYLTAAIVSTIFLQSALKKEPKLQGKNTDM